MTSFVCSSLIFTLNLSLTLCSLSLLYRHAHIAGAEGLCQPRTGAHSHHGPQCTSRPRLQLSHGVLVIIIFGESRRCWHGLQFATGRITGRNGHSTVAGTGTGQGCLHAGRGDGAGAAGGAHGDAGGARLNASDSIRQQSYDQVQSKRSVNIFFFTRTMFGQQSKTKEMKKKKTKESSRRRRQKRKPSLA